MKWLNLLFGGLFALFAYFQLNDPDSLLWVILYLIVAELFVFAWFEKGSRELTLGVMVLLFALAAAHAPGLLQFFFNEDGITFSQGMSNEYPYIEQAREFGGLVIAGVSLIWLYRWQKQTT